MALKYLAQADLENALSAATVLNLYDDGSGSVNTTALNANLERAEAEVDSYLIALYPMPLTESNDRLVKHAALQFAIVFSFDRHPEYVRTFGEDPRASNMYQRACGVMARVVKGMQRPTEQPAPPANVGGDVSSMVDDPAYPCPPKPMFDNMGDFSR